MQIKIIAPYPGATTSGMFGADGKEVEIGTELTVSDNTDLPAGRYEIVSGSADGKTAILNPDDASDTPDREELKKHADELGITYPSNIPTAKLKDLVDAKLAA